MAVGEGDTGNPCDQLLASGTAASLTQAASLRVCQGRLGLCWQPAPGWDLTWHSSSETLTAGPGCLGQACKCRPSSLNPHLLPPSVWGWGRSHPHRGSCLLPASGGVASEPQLSAAAALGTSQDIDNVYTASGLYLFIW